MSGMSTTYDMSGMFGMSQTYEVYDMSGMSQTYSWQGMTPLLALTDDMAYVIMNNVDKGF